VGRRSCEPVWLAKRDYGVKFAAVAVLFHVVGGGMLVAGEGIPKPLGGHWTIWSFLQYGKITSGQVQQLTRAAPFGTVCGTGLLDHRNEVRSS